MKRQAGRRNPQLLRDFTRCHAFRAGNDKLAKDGEAGFVSERAERAYGIDRVHVDYFTRSISIFQEMLK
jgi:hypothetical protein